MIRLEELTKVFGTPQGPIIATDRVSLELPKGEICVLLGPSGCGKTTTMKLINRLLAPTSGKIFLDGEDTDRIDPIQLRRRIGYVIQQVGLFPNKTVADNVCVVPDLLGWNRKASRRRAAELLELVALDPAAFMKRFPRELSGGQQQRVGVARALAADPPVMLMDEPFGAIDPINREALQDEFLRMQGSLHKTIVFVSHDLNEAVKMADKIAIFNKGRIEQFGSPAAILSAPANDFVRDFLGSDVVLKRLALARVGQAMDSGCPTVRDGESLAAARDVLARFDAEAVVVVSASGQPRFLLPRQAVQAADGPVRGLGLAIEATARVDDDLRGAVVSMLTHGLSVMPCVDGDGILRGLLTYRSIARSLASRGGA